MDQKAYKGKKQEKTFVEFFSRSTCCITIKVSGIDGVILLLSRVSNDDDLLALHSQVGGASTESNLILYKGRKLLRMSPAA